MIKVKMHLVTGTALEFECESMVTRSLNNELFGYTIKGINGSKMSPDFVNLDKVIAIETQIIEKVNADKLPEETDELRAKIKRQTSQLAGNSKKIQEQRNELDKLQEENERLKAMLKPDFDNVELGE